MTTEAALAEGSVLSQLFDHGALLPHGTCLVWRPGLLWLHAVSDLLTALAYYSVPFALVVFALRRKDLRFRWMFMLFGLFIMACGTTHVMSLWTLWVPDYGIEGMVKAATAIASVATAALMWPLIPRALAMPGPAQWQAVNAELRGEIVERKAAEQQVWQLNAELELRVEQRTAELVAANVRLGSLNEELREEIEMRKQIEVDLRAAKDDAESANLAKSRFMAAASHDLRQPVQALMLLTEGLTRRLRDQPKLAIFLDNILSSVDGLQRLLEGMLDLSRLDAGVIVPKFAVHPIHELLPRLAREYLPVAEAKGLKLRAVVSREWCRTDPVLLERILRNLIENAIRYTENGGLLLGCRRRGDQLLLQVVDSGLGIPADQQQAVFQEFYQLGNPERDRRKGLGLGLSIVQRLAKVMEHRLSLSSVPGKGSCFSIMVERATGGELAENRPVEAAMAILAQRVLLIEDESSVRLGMEVLFRDWGAQVVAVADEDAAIAEITDGCRPQLVVADYRLREGRNGVEAIHAVRGACGYPVKAMILTGETGSDVIAVAAQAGLPLVYKPLSAERIKAVLASMAALVERDHSTAERR